MRAAASTQAWIECDDRRRFRLECGRKVQAINGAHRHRERQDQLLGTTMNRRGQFGIAGRRMQFDPSRSEALRFLTREALFGVCGAQARMPFC